MLVDYNDWKHLFGIAVGTLFMLLLLAGGAGATEWTVDDDDPGANFSTILEAITNANPGDTILVYSGTYVENVVVDKQLILRGVDDGEGMPIVDGGDWGGGSSDGITFSVDGITLDGFAITNSNYGIYLTYSNDNTITNNIVDDNVSSNNYGIYIESSNNNTLTNNTANSNSYGIYISNSNSNTVEGSLIDLNTYGIYTTESGSSAYGDVYRGNTITNTTSDGIYLYETSLGIYDTTIENNTITTSLNGIHLEKLSMDIYNIMIRGNTIRDASNYGLFLQNNVGSTVPNTIYNNYFNNTNNASDDGTNIWNTTQTSGANIVGGTVLGGNFWASPDSNGFSQTCTPNIDEICNQPFSINEVGSIDFLSLASSPSGGATPNFVTANPIRALTRSGAATRFPTNVYFYYNGSIIRVNVSLNQSGLTVSGDFADVDNSSSISTSTSYQNGSAEEYIYTLTATAGNVGIGVQTVTITATNTSTGATNVSLSAFIALMNINPLVLEPALGGTNWTEIDDFTNATLTFEKFEDATHAVRLGKLEFLNPMNLADSTTGAALMALGTNLQMAQDSMNLNSAAGALEAMNVSSRLTMYNLTEFSNSPGILQDEEPVVTAGQTSGGAVSGLSWYPNSTLVFQVDHWTNYSADGQAPVVTFSSLTPADGSINTTGNVTIQFSLNENGSARLNWRGVNETMTEFSNKNFRINETGLLSGNYTFMVYANDTVGNTNVSETRIVTINRTTVSITIGTIINSSTFITNATLEIAAPSGNVTVTIPNGTNASVGGFALASISVDSIAQVNSTFTLGSNDRLVGENLSLGPEGARFSPDIQIRFNYTDEMLTAAGISASELRVKFYNTATNIWDVQTPYTLNETGKYIIANVSHFSTFALMGTITTSTTTAAGSSGSGTGGSGVTTSEPLDNIIKAERYDKNLIANTPVTYIFSAPEHGIYEIAITGKENENDIAVRVEALKSTSKLVNTSAPGTVYKNINIWAGTKRIKEALIRFKVENSWLTGSSFASNNVKMVKWDGSKWVQIETAEKTKDTTFTYYEAKTYTLSQFAITGLKDGATLPTAMPASGVTETPKTNKIATSAPTPVFTKKVSGFELGLVVTALFSVCSFGRKRR